MRLVKFPFIGVHSFPHEPLPEIGAKKQLQTLDIMATLASRHPVHL